MAQEVIKATLMRDPEPGKREATGVKYSVIRGQRRSVADILRASYELLADDKETVIALRVVLGSNTKNR